MKPKYQLYRRANQPFRLPTFLKIAIFIFIAAVLIYISIPTINPSASKARSARQASQLIKINHLIKTYQSQHAGLFPAQSSEINIPDEKKFISVYRYLHDDHNTASLPNPHPPTEASFSIGDFMIFTFGKLPQHDLPEKMLLGYGLYTPSNNSRTVLFTDGQVVHIKPDAFAKLIELTNQQRAKLDLPKIEIMTSK